ncbi:MAG: hypothetical protein IT427_08880 [Pirellulales bacterium]|nr:hypothetical protein [Pirellulales bacterium]
MLTRLLRHALTLIIVVAAVLLLADLALACPNCKEGIAANDPQHASLVRGYFYSILLMMGTPFAMITCFSLYMYREVQKSRIHQAAKGADKELHTTS